MNEKIIENYNKVIKQNDIVYHLGDFCFAKKELAEPIFNRLNGQKILIEGNHDSSDTLKLKWAWVKNYYKLKTDKATFILFHYPIASWEGSFRSNIHLHGHSHHNLKSSIPLRRIDVGIDGHMYDYSPISLDDVLALVKDIPEAFTEAAQ